MAADKKTVGIALPPSLARKVDDRTAVHAVMDQFALEIEHAASYICKHPDEFHGWMIAQVKKDYDLYAEKFTAAVEASDVDQVTLYARLKGESFKQLQSLNNQLMGYHATMNKPSVHNKGKGNPWAEQLKNERNKDVDARA